MGQFKMGFWNYVNTGVLDPKEAVRDWKELGFNFPMSFEYDPTKHDKKQMTMLLDECQAQGMQTVVCDIRTRFSTLIEKGEAAFKKGVADAVKDFGAHPAVSGFHVGDEPGKQEWDAAVNAYKIVKSAAPKLSPFINFLPLWDEANFEEALGVKGEKYGELLSATARDAKLELMCYDYYGQCAYFEQERYTDLCIQNLLLFGDVARKNDVPFYTSLLSVGHWSMRCPSEDDLRWQLSVSAALGVVGILWFFVYERTLDDSFRNPPINLFWEKTETYTWLSRQNRIFMQYYGDKFASMRFVKAYGMNHSYGNLEAFPSEGEPLSVEFIVNEKAPLLVSRFIDADGKTAYAIVNLERDMPVKIKTNKGGKGGIHWLAPGQLALIEGF